MGCVGFDEAFVICKVVVVPIKALLLAIEEFEGGRSFFPLFTASPAFDYFDDAIRHRERSNCARFLDDPGIYVENLVRALEVAGGTKENARERACLHCVGDDLVFMDFDVRFKGGFEVLLKSSSRPVTIMRGEYFSEMPTAEGRLLSQKTEK